MASLDREGRGCSPGSESPRRISIKTLRGVEKMSGPDPDLKLVVVFESDNPVELDLAQAALQEAGIEFTLGPPATPEFGFTPILNPVSRILVAETAVAKAREILDGLSAEAEEHADENQPEN